MTAKAISHFQADHILTRFVFPPLREVGYDMRLERTESLTRPKGNGRSEAECLALITAHLEKYPCMTRTDYCYMTGHDKKRALKELNAFIEKGILMRYGAGKQVIYAKKMI